MSYRIPDDSFHVDIHGSIPTIRFEANMSSTHFHVQVNTSAGWQMVVDDVGLGRKVPIQGGPIRSVSDFAGKRFFWDITLADFAGSSRVEAVLDIFIEQDGNTLLHKHDVHFITGQESYYEFLDAI
jgi:hypothetical protein